MFNIGGGEFLIIFLVALVVLGPTKLPEAARQLGKVVGEFRKISSSFQRELQDAMKDPVGDALRDAESSARTGPDVTKIAQPGSITQPGPIAQPGPITPAEPTAVEPTNTEATSQSESDAGDPPMFGDR